MSACAIERAAGMRSAVRSHHQGATMRRSARRVQRSSPSNQCLLSSRSANVAQVFIAPRTMGSSTVWVNGQASGTLRLFATRPSREAVRRPASCVSSSISSSALDAQAYEAELDRQVDALNLGQLPFAEPAGAGTPFVLTKQSFCRGRVRNITSLCNLRGFGLICDYWSRYAGGSSLFLDFLFGEQG